MISKKHLISGFILLSFCLSLKAQQNQLLAADIKTLQVIVNDNWQLPPVIELDSEDYLEISFDHLSHEYHRYIYAISHHNADWSASDLNEIDFLDGFNHNPIDEYQSSLNTTMHYNHYSLQIPNEQVALTASGNYVVSIYEDGKPDAPLLKACFSVIERNVSVSATVSSNTDISTNTSHQQVSFAINHAGYTIQNPQSEIKVQVTQNQRWDNKVTALLPTYVSNGELQYTHNRQLIFNAGNEYRRFDMPEVHYTYQGVEDISFFDPYYHAELFADTKRKNYSFDIDQNGQYIVRSTQAADNNTEADYLFVHFSLQLDQLPPEGDIYLQGAFTNHHFGPDNKLTYNPQTEQYECVQLLKQGAYNYMYLFVPHGDKKGETAPIEGDFYETENEYMILVYHRPFGERYDKLVGMQTVKM